MTARKRPVLIVEKHPGLANLIAKVLRRSGHATSVVVDPPSAVSAALEFRPEVAIVGVDSLHGRGYEVARALRNVPELSSCIFVGLTRDTSDHSQQTGIVFHRFLSKPFEIEALLRAVADDD